MNRLTSKLAYVLLFPALLGACKKSSTQTGDTQPERQISTEAAPTSGWTQTSYTYSIQTSWDQPQSNRYSYSAGEHRFWIYPTDACQYEGCSTGPRSELRMNNNYTSGKHQFEGDVYIVSGSAGTDIMQVFGGATNATAIMLKIHSPAAVPSNGTTMKHS